MNQLKKGSVLFRINELNLFSEERPSDPLESAQDKEELGQKRTQAQVKGR